MLELIESTIIKFNMNYYSQYLEDKIVSEFAKKENIVGNILDIGANDGKTLSNSLHFIENNWGATLIEASPISFNKMVELHKNNQRVQCLNVCLADVDKKSVFYHNITHLHKNDCDLLSTISKENFIDSKNSGNEFTSFEIDCYTFKSIKKLLKYKSYEIISIDIEGYDYEVLSQINLNEINCKVLIIEHNNNLVIKDKIINYCKLHNLSKILHDNMTNIIITSI